MELSGNVAKSELVMILLENKFDPNTNIARLPYIPGTDKRFEIFADKIQKSNQMVDVVEVRDVAPVNPNRNEENEAKNRKPLRFGSRTDVTTAGNWE